MTLQYSATIRNAKLDAIESTAGASCSMSIFSGTPPAGCSSANSGTLLVTFNLPADWLANASSGSKAKAGTWSGTASNTGTAGHFRIYNSQATKDGTTCFMQGTVNTAGADLNLDNTSINNGQTVTINSFQLNDNNP